MYRIYYANDGTFTYGDADFPPVHDVLVVLQEHPGNGWITDHGGDFYIWKYGRWYPASLDALLRFLDLQGLIRPTIGRKHDVRVKNKWVKVDTIGFYTWIEKEGHALFGTFVSDEEFGRVMYRVLADKNYADEHGVLPD